MPERLTERRFWDDYWKGVRLPAEFAPDAKRSLLTVELARHFDACLPRGAGLSALEIGGAPGQYLAYLHRVFGYRVHCLDDSAEGCGATRRNFELLGLPGEVTQGDVLDDALTLRTHDVVYSLGLIEHFEDFGAVARRHLRLLKPGGTLMLGVPNLRGINHWFRRRLAPRSLREHNLDAMDLDGWTPFENAERLEVVFKGYIGGLEPSVLGRCEAKTLRNLPARRMAKLLDVLLRKRCRFLRRFNSPRFSGYALGVYRKPGGRREGGAA